MMNRPDLFLTVVPFSTWKRHLTDDAKSDLHIMIPQHFQKDTCSFVVRAGREVAHVKRLPISSGRVIIKRYGYPKHVFLRGVSESYDLARRRAIQTYPFPFTFSHFTIKLEPHRFPALPNMGSKASAK